MDARRPDRPGSVIGRTLSVLLAAGACVIGVLVGRAIAYSTSIGGLGGAFEAAFLSLLLVVAVVVLALIALIATRLRHGLVSQPIVTVLAAAGLLASGAVGGNATAAAFGGLYHDPIVLEARGETTFDVHAGDMLFTARLGGPAVCQSVPDGETVWTIAAAELGELGPGTLRATLNLTADDSDRATAEFWIDGGDLPDGSVQPFWSGSVRITEMGPDSATGKLIFTDLGRSMDPALKDPGLSTETSVAPEWPSAISGVMGWTCEAW